MSLNGSSYGQITGLGAAAVQYKYGDTLSLTLLTGNAGTVVNVLSTGVPTTLSGHWASTVNVGNAGTVQDIRGTLTLQDSGSAATAAQRQ